MGCQASETGVPNGGPSGHSPGHPPLIRYGDPRDGYHGDPRRACCSPPGSVSRYQKR